VTNDREVDRQHEQVRGVVSDASTVAHLFVKGRDQGTELRVMPTRPGGDARVLLDNPEIRVTIPVGWRSDDALLVLMMSPDPTWRLSGPGT
jgi:hypothetical protein